MSTPLEAPLAAMSLLVLLAALPLLPSILIYKLFPDTQVAANGPLAGLTLRTSGAFAIYVIVFLVLSPFAYKTYPYVDDLTSINWTIEGTVHLVDSSGAPMPNAAAYLKHVHVTTTPDVLGTTADQFKLKIPEIDHHIPTLTFSVGDGDLGSAVVNTDNRDAVANRDSAARTIKLAPVTIQMIDAQGRYDSNAQPLQAQSEKLTVLQTSTQR